MEDSILVKDRYFKTFISAEQIVLRVQELGEQISMEMKGREPLFLVVLNGAFVFAADLLRSVTTPCHVSFIRVSSYDGMESTGRLTQVLGLPEKIEGRSVVIVEDIIDSGLTMQALTEQLQAMRPADLRICTLLAKPGNLQAELDIDYCAFRIPNDFIVGYGLDYDGYGRELKDIYVVE